LSFSYQYGANPPIDYPRLLVSDTLATNHIFEDAEITAASTMASGTFQSAPFAGSTWLYTSTLLPIVDVTNPAFAIAPRRWVTR